MKKILTKLIIISILTGVLSVFFLNPSSTVIAENGSSTENEEAQIDERLANIEAEIRNDIADLEKGKKACLQTEKGEDDDGYIVTFIEEPLRTLEKEEKSADSTFKERPCYRHTFRDTEGKIYSVLSRSPCHENMHLHDKIAELGDTPAYYTCRTIHVILSKGGTAMLYHYIGMIYRWGVSIAGIIAVLVIVLNGIRISVSGGDPEAINKSKRMIIQSLAAIAVLILSGLILYTINPDFFVR